jgi:hypothetical protein
MGFILKLVVLLLVVAVGGFAFLTYTYPSPYDKYGMWEKVNGVLPQQARKFTCAQVKEHSTGVNPQSCADVGAN